MADTIKKWTESILPWLLDHGLKIVFIAVAAWLLNKILSRIIIRTVRVAIVANENMSKEGEKKREDTLIRIFNGALRIVILILAILMILQELGLKIGPLIAGAGIVGLAVGFGGQYLIRDIISGLFLILENQYRIGDSIDINGVSGLVEDISLRKTTLRDINGTVHHIPHGEIKLVSNLSKNYARVNLDIGISYNTDLDHAISVINRTGKELAEDPAFSDSIISPPQFLRVNDFADSAVILKILGDTKPLKQWEVTGEMRKRLKIAFDREGIEIPFPQRVIHENKTGINGNRT
ncbi:MAG TPA: mechanosensitive ion channel family protein [Bacteroidales bacterium]|nr:mechanosensitive ion channel family protein [Bacteroidales bacterium]HOX73119.1 mechanosensitive ion channel family protein [Bacteroidales bacterium]HPM86430.1 mechanosensitive ion channel family protein [Bacteroidales bacterium]HQM69717.1 mechanosensitive ion channel family protein [Bacteroidales bacterium]